MERSQECLLSCCTLKIKQSGQTIGWHATISVSQILYASKTVISRDGRICARAEATVSRLISLATDGARQIINDVNARLNGGAKLACYAHTKTRIARQRSTQTSAHMHALILANLPRLALRVAQPDKDKDMSYVTWALPR